MLTYTVNLSFPFRSSPDQGVRTVHQRIVLNDPPLPSADLIVNASAAGRAGRFRLAVPTIDSEGTPLPDRTQINITVAEVVEAADVIAT